MTTKERATLKKFFKYITVIMDSLDGLSTSEIIPILQKVDSNIKAARDDYSPSTVALLNMWYQAYFVPFAVELIDNSKCVNTPRPDSSPELHPTYSEYGGGEIFNLPESSNSNADGSQ